MFAALGDCGRRVLRRWRAPAACFVLAFTLAPGLLHAQTAPGVSDKEIVLGGVFPLTGPLRLLSEPYEQAIRAYFNKMNAEGGIHGRQIKWLVEDDGYQPARTLAGAKKLVERDHVFLLFGLMGSSMIAAVAPYAEQAKVPTFTATSPPPPQLRYTFGLMATYEDLLYVSTRYTLKSTGAKKLAYFYQNDDFGASGRAGVDRALKEDGTRLAADVGYERGTNDFSTYVLKLRDSGADAVLSMSTPGSTATAVKQALGMNYRPVWIAGSSGGTNSMEQLLKENINGMVFGSELESQFSDTPAIREVRDLMAKYYPGAKLDWAGIMGYAQARLIVQVLQGAGKSPTREAVYNLVEKGTQFDVGVMPPFSYGPTRRTAASAVKIFQWEGSKAVAKTDWISVAKEAQK